MSIRVLIAEDDANLREGLVDLLESEGYEVVTAENGVVALAKFASDKPGLVILDVMMPEKSGYDVCREIRKSDGRTPIIMLTAKGEEIDKVVGLELGADDYVTKPFGLHELRARIAAVLRRSTGPAPTPAADLPDSFAFGHCRVNRKTFELVRAGESYSLTARELKLLEIFHLHQGEVLSRNDLLNAAWGIDYFGTTRTLDQHMALLRKKIESDPARPELLLTVHGIGYKLRSDQN